MRCGTDDVLFSILTTEVDICSISNGFDEEVVTLTLKSSWWREMVTDIVETPDFADPEESPEQVLQYARDLVFEYVGKRLYPYSSSSDSD